MFKNDRLEILERTETRMREIADATSHYSGEDYLNALVCVLSKALSADYVLIAVPKENGTTQLETLSLCHGDKLLPSLEYDYLGTPCENVYGKKVCSYPKNVAELFPGDLLLQEMNIEAYLGVPLYTDKEKNIGVLVCLFNECLHEENSVQTILEFFAHRVAGEIQRLATIEDLTKLNKEYLTLNEQYQIQNEKLEFALEQTIAEERLKSAFLQNISHEIRTPMNGILGFSNLLDNDQLSRADLQEYSKYIVSSCNQLLSVVNDILYVSNIESGQVETNEDELNLNALLKQLHKGFKEKLTDKNIEFTYHSSLPDRDSHIVTDGLKLKQILWNLIMNAIKFTPEGFVRFGYEIKEKDIEFYVQDSGIGIPENMWEDIFKPFHQVDSSTQREFDGIGLGLSICAGYVKKLGGKIWFKSQLSKGTSLYFTIPYNKA
ncbi:ATP-binding protein [Ancylomarina sp. DW003]|nr:ATP-binding protein [Ancylomarina sp. DW003]MDE5420637.1 ATP-binding protein [Ancylomarina sp. DW003]